MLFRSELKFPDLKVRKYTSKGGKRYYSNNKYWEIPLKKVNGVHNLSFSEYKGVPRINKQYIDDIQVKNSPRKKKVMNSLFSVHKRMNSNLQIRREFCLNSHNIDKNKIKKNTGMEKMYELYNKIMKENDTKDEINKLNILIPNFDDSYKERIIDETAKIKPKSAIKAKGVKIFYNYKGQNTSLTSEASLVIAKELEVLRITKPKPELYKLNLQLVL